jgi:hypothetical protein
VKSCHLSLTGSVTVGLEGTFQFEHGSGSLFLPDFCDLELLAAVCMRSRERKFLTSRILTMRVDEYGTRRGSRTR